MNRVPWARLGRASGFTLFWGWNLLFFAVLWLGLGPAVLLELFVASFAGMVPWSFPCSVGSPS